MEDPKIDQHIIDTIAQQMDETLSQECAICDKQMYDCQCTDEEVEAWVKKFTITYRVGPYDVKWKGVQ